MSAPFRKATHPNGVPIFYHPQRTSTFVCPACQKPINGHTATKGDVSAPVDGDISLCAHCYGVAQYEGGTLRAVDVETLDQETRDNIKAAIVESKRMLEMGLL